MQPNLNKDPYFFDAIESAKELQESGFSREQAETQTKIISNVLSLVSRSNVTKQDLELLEERLKRHIEEKVNELELKLVELESKLINKFFIAIGLATGILGLLIAYFH